MRRVAVLGRGGSGKSSLAQRLSVSLGIPVVELDSLFWHPGPWPTPDGQWAEIQREVVARDRWVIDGDFGRYDTGLALRLRAADTVVVLDFPLWRCVWHALRWSRETREFWMWLYRYRRDSLPIVTKAIATHASHAAVHVLYNPRDVNRFITRCSGPGRSV
jgi:adenylate kinase family enzyme